jgi:hypothetical protein
VTIAIAQPSRPSHRLLPGDPDRYITKKCNRWHARPWHAGSRHYLGSFPTAHAARRARDAFFRGELQPIPKYTRRSKSGKVRVQIYLNGEPWVIPCTASTAAKVAFSHLVDVIGEEAAKEAMKRK